MLEPDQHSVLQEEDSRLPVATAVARDGAIGSVSWLLLLLLLLPALAHRAFHRSDLVAFLPSFAGSLLLLLSPASH